MIKIAYFGSPNVSAYVLEELIKNQQNKYKIQIVFTQSAKPQGRGLQHHETPVAKVANANGTKLVDTALNKSTKDSFVNLLKEQQIDLCIVYAYKFIIPQSVLDAVPMGFLNIHPSMLPAWRGPTPTVFPFIFNQTETGVSIIYMNNKMDEGDLLHAEKTTILQSDNAQTILDRLTKIACTKLVDIINNKSFSGAKPQFGAPTYSILLNKEMGFIEASKLNSLVNEQPVNLGELNIFAAALAKNATLTPPIQDGKTLYNIWAALHPWPGLHTKIKYKDSDLIVKIIEVKLNPEQKSEIAKIQIEGKKPVDFKTFLANYSLI